MERHGSARDAVFPRKNNRFGVLPGRGRDRDILIACGLGKDEVSALEERARAAVTDPLVKFCEERGVNSIDAYLEANGL